MKFKKIYGKKLKELWKEWIEYEIKMNEDADNIEENKPEIRKITNLKGDIIAFDKYKDSLLISSVSYKNDRLLYLLHDSGRLEKLDFGYHRSVSATGSEDYILYTKPVPYPGGFNYFELFSFNMKTG